MVGKTLGHYEILEPLGSGGMGEVYRARDTKLDRDVAIKVLPEDFATDQDRLARFEREAKLLASLNHANIAAIYGLEDEGEQRFIAMELVEGETLAERISRSGRIEVDEALDIVRQIAEALEAAHENGVIHRDLKPANVVVTPKGKAKVLDFGLAKAYEADGSSSNISPDLSHSPTMAAVTRTGVILGTAAYMSPEQARGKSVDKRTDIWAFGCVLYEMLAGTKAFAGETVSDTMAAILKEEPDWSELATETPFLIRRLLRRCLEKDRKRRIPDIGMARFEIDDALADPESGEALPSHKTVGRRGVLLAAAATALVATTGTWLVLGRATMAAGVVRFTVQVEGGHEMFTGEGPRLAMSPDGRTLAYVGQGGVYLRALDRAESSVLEGTERAESPFFSPDGQWLGFVRDGGLKKISMEGGSAVDITGGDEFVGRYAGASWARNDTIVYAKQGSRALWRVPAAGGVSEEITTFDDGGTEPFRRWPQVLDGGGREVLYTRLPSRDWEDAQIVVEDFDSGALTIVAAPGVYGRYVSSGHIVYVTGTGAVLAVPYDLAGRQVTGDPFAVESGVRVAIFGGGASLAVSDGGTAAFVHGSNETRNVLWWVSRSGRRIRQLGDPLSIFYVNLSPDEEKLVLDTGSPSGGSIWLVDGATGVRDRVTFDDVWAFSPIWSPAGDRVAYVSYSSEHEADTVFVQDVRGGGPPLPVHPAKPEANLWVSSWFADWLAFSETDDGLEKLFVLRLDGGAAPIPVARSSEAQTSPQFSPAGRWLAYESEEGDQPEIYVVSFPELGNKRQVSTEGGRAPRWSPDGSELFFWTRDGTLMVSRGWGSEVPVREPLQDLFQEGDMLSYHQYVVASGEEQFLLGLRNPASLANEIHVVVNWSEKLKQLEPAGR